LRGEVTTLSAVSEAEFATLRAALDVSDSVLSKHVSALADAGYVRTRKGVRAEMYPSRLRSASPVARPWTRADVNTEGRPWKRCAVSSGVFLMPFIANWSPMPKGQLARAREGTAGRLKNPARSTYPRTSTLRISHFPDPRNRRYNRPRVT